MKPIRIGLVGVGKIARDQHIPALRANGNYELVACASRNAQVDGVANHGSLAEMLDTHPDLDAVAIATPPQVHYEAASLALSRGKHVFLEKPPCSTTAQLDRLAARAREAERTLFQTWHSRFARGITPARRWLASRSLKRVTVTWKEDVRQWHPGQTWIWQAGGFGVFDPGINALSILTEILPEAFFVKSAELFVPENCEAPIAADIDFVTDSGVSIAAAFDFRHTGVQTWDIDVETDKGALKLADGGSKLVIDGAAVPGEGPDGPHGEYVALYARFADLIARGQSEVDGRPFQLVADSFLAGKRTSIEAFVE